MSINVKETIEANQLRTARGRRQLSGKEINVNTSAKASARESAIYRSSGYLDVIRALRQVVETNPEGISYDELDAAEFIIEQLERVAARAWETATKNN